MKDKLIELMRETPTKCEHDDCYVCILNGITDEQLNCIADHLIANGGTIPQWIPVSGRLPERNGKYMVHASVRGHKYIDCVSFAQDLYRIDPYDFHGRKGESGFYAYDNEYGFGEYEGVTHWMPLPEPPKGE